MRNIKLVIEYDGTNYHGWQSQANAPTVCDILQGAVKKLTGEDCNLTGSGRTDAGAHALGQAANFITASSVPANRFSYALNGILPDDIVIKCSEEVSMDFHARYSAKGKKYRYLIYNSPFPSALLRNRAFHVPPLLDPASMQKACLSFAGARDFSAFRASGSSVGTSSRTVTEVSLAKVDDMVCNAAGNIIKFEISADGFLYNMVRIIAGTLVEVGMGKKSPGDMAEIIEGRDRKKAGKTAPAHGLYLVEVFY